MSASPSESAAAGQQQRRGAVIAIIGILLQIFQVFALVAGLILIVKAYAVFATLFDGSGDQAPLKAAGIQFLIIVGLALCGCVIGILMIMYAAIRCRYRAPWFYSFLVGYGWYMIMSPPLTPLGVWMTYYAKTHRKEFEVSSDKLE